MKKLLIAATAAAVLLTACGQNSQTAAPQTEQTASAAAQAQSQTERNKANTLAFYDLAFNQHQLQQAVDQYIGSEYIQHNPGVADGGQAFIDAFAPFLKENPQSRAEVKRVMADGDLVMLHVFSQANPQDQGEAVVDIFRLDENGKIVEHWDVIQAMPTEFAHSNGMF
ncbi:MAG: ester cyclase [Neisseria sp.]|nr:ester cyclase [Neisseria sp.]